MKLNELFSDLILEDGKWYSIQTTVCKINDELVVDEMTVRRLKEAIDESKRP